MDTAAPPTLGSASAQPPLPPELDAYALRRLAEAAAGLNGRLGYLRIVRGNDGAPGRLVVEAGPAPAGDPDVVLQVPQTAPGAQVPGQFDVWLQRRGAQDTEAGGDGADAPAGEGWEQLTKRFDAFWWSRSSVEKFMVPYYVRLFEPHEYAGVVDTFTRAFDQGLIIGFGHLPWSEWEQVTARRIFYGAGFAPAFRGGIQIFSVDELQGLVA